MWSACSDHLLAGGWRMAGAGLLMVIGGAQPVHSAETTTPFPTRKTELVLKLATHQVVPVQSRLLNQPPTLILDFPPGRVSGSLPERSVIQQGIIEEIRTTYAVSPSLADARWIEAVAIQLRGPYRCEVHPEPGQIVIEIEHPSNLITEAVFVGVPGKGLVIASESPPRFSERFEAMQKALTIARPRTWIWNVNAVQSVPSVSIPSRSVEAPRREPPPVVSPQPHVPSAAASIESRVPVSSRPSSRAWWPWVALGVLAAGAGAWWGCRQVRDRSSHTMTQGHRQGELRLIDQLVWHAFERQGYRLVQTVELEQFDSPIRVIEKDSQPIGLSCIGNGFFFEKSAVEQFAKSLAALRLEQGFLVAPGSYTVPAQRCAKDRRIHLIGRDQLVALLSEGAMSEQYSKQVQQFRAQVEDSRTALQGMTEQAETLRSQRNEASWFLGEERAKSATLQEQIAQLTQQLQQQHVDLERWRTEADATRKQWEENEWYLGEARASLQHFEEQLQTYRAEAQRWEEQSRRLEDAVLSMTQQRDEANWYLGEAKSASEQWRQQIQQLTASLAEAEHALTDSRAALEESQRAREAERAARQALEAELVAIRATGERRRAPRLVRPGVRIHLQTAGGTPLFDGPIRDISRTGFGLDLDQGIELPEAVRIRLSFPNRQEPLESAARVVWNDEEPLTHRRRIGGLLTGLSVAQRESLDEALVQS